MLHLITSSWILLSFVLAASAFPEWHTEVAFSEKIKETTEQFMVKDKVTAVVHDQAASLELSLSILNDEEGWSSLHCSSHCLQLCLIAGLEIRAIYSLLAASRKLVGHFRHSVVASEGLSINVNK